LRIVTEDNHVPIVIQVQPKGSQVREQSATERNCFESVDALDGGVGLAVADQFNASIFVFCRRVRFAGLGTLIMTALAGD
jgi:hypothetical protein